MGGDKPWRRASGQSCNLEEELVGGARTSGRSKKEGEKRVESN